MESDIVEIGNDLVYSDRSRAGEALRKDGLEEEVVVFKEQLRSSPNVSLIEKAEYHGMLHYAVPFSFYYADTSCSSKNKSPGRKSADAGRVGSWCGGIVSRSGITS